MQRRVLPVAAEIDRNVDAAEQGAHVARVPEGVMRRVLDGDLAPETPERLFGVMGVDKVFENGDDRLAIEMRQPRMDGGQGEDMADDVEARLAQNCGSSRPSRRRPEARPK